MFVDSLVGKLKKGQSTNSTDGSFSALISTTTKPAASATRTIIDVPLPRNEASTLVVFPYGGNADNDVINVKVSGWSRIVNPLLSVDQWVSFLICEVQATLSSTLLGLAGQHVVATEFFADTLTLTTGVATLFNGTANVDTAYFVCDVGGAELVEITGDLGTGGDTMNWLWRWE